jgi:hypothetical protein
MVMEPGYLRPPAWFRRGTRQGQAMVAVESVGFQSAVIAEVRVVVVESSIRSINGK